MRIPGPWIDSTERHIDSCRHVRCTQRPRYAEFQQTSTRSPLLFKLDMQTVGDQYKQCKADLILVFFFYQTRIDDIIRKT